MRTWHKLFVAGALLGLAACGGEPDLTQAGGNIDQASLNIMKANNAFADFTNQIIPQETGAASPKFGNLPTGVGSLSAEEAQARATGYEDCTTSSGSTADGADGDGIFLSYRQDFNCVGIPVTGDSGTSGTSALTGFFSEIDKDDTLSGDKGGYKWQYDITYAYDLSHEKMGGTFSGLSESTFSGGTLTQNWDYKVAANHTDVATGAKSNWYIKSKWLSMYTGDDPANPYLAGTMTLNGFFGLGGNFYESTSKTDVKLDVVFEISTEGLTYDRAACPTSFWKNGKLTFKDGSGNQYTYTYTNCTVATTFNGATI